MPLRDHFRTRSGLMQWERLHAQWPAMIVTRLNEILPQEYYASPRVYLGKMMELDVAALERESMDRSRQRSNASEEGLAWSPSAPTQLLETEIVDDAEYAVNVFTSDEHRIVASIELVSPSNKDRPEHRRAFVNKCVALLRKQVSVTIVDPVISRSANLYGELIDELDGERTTVANTAIYAVTCRGSVTGRRWRLDAWEEELSIGRMLPIMPVWLNDDRSVPLELERTYEESCRALRMI